MGYNASIVTASQQATKTVLHVGCGHPDPRTLHATFQGDEWREVRLDIDPNVKPDIVASITDMSVVESESVDAVWSSHNLEHLYAHEVPLAIGEFRRVIKPGGFALITMPDLQTVAALIADDKLEDAAYTSPAGPIAPLDMVYGHRGFVARGNAFMAHRTGFTAKSLARHILAAGFSRARVKREKWDLWAIADR